MKMGNLERNTYVKEQIMQATIELLYENEMKQISIADITNKAQVSRVSFYRNFETKEDIIKTYIGKMVLDWNMNTPEVKDKKDDDEMLASLFGMLKEHNAFFLLLSKRGLLDLLRNVLKELYGPKPEFPNLGAYFAAFLFYGIYGWIEEWIARGMQESATEMAELLKHRNLSM